MRLRISPWGRWMLIPLLAAGLVPHPRAAQQSDRDPLTDQEIEQVRENAVHPIDRIKLYMKFIEERIDAIKELAGDSKINNRAPKLRAKLDEFTRLCDELQDNLDTYDAAHADLRKALKDLVPASAKWPDVLNLGGADPAYDFSRKTALAAAQSVSDEAKQMQTEQEKYFAEHKDERNKNGAGPN